MQMSMLPKTEGSRGGFYPTPEPLANEMLAGIEWDLVETILEPSAGKGDLADSVAKAYKRGKNCYWSNKVSVDLDCIEIDANLRGALKENGFRVVHDDFLTFETCKRYSLIVMNPPFDRGAEHLLKALDVQKRGGSVICLLNAQTLRNPYTHARQVLAKKLDELGATITYKQSAFAGSDALRKTNVEVAIVKCIVPKAEDSILLDNLHRDFAQKEAKENEDGNGFLAKNDFVAAALDQYNFEIAAGVKIIQEYEAIKEYLTETLNPDAIRKEPIFVIASPHDGRRGMANAISENYYIRKTRRKFWEALFMNPKFTKGMTSNLLLELRAKLDDFEHYDFSHHNIMQLFIDTNKQMFKGIEDTILALFDDWTYKYHYGEYSQNRQYFDGWKTNECFKVGKRVIVPLWGVWSQWSGEFNPASYEHTKTITDIQKVFDYLSGRKGDDGGVKAVLEAAKREKRTKKIQLEYFMVTFYKKGTMHIEFTDMDVLQRFNLYAAQRKGWLPPAYGKKRYKDMSGEEKAVVDSYEGEKSYDKVLERREYFLGDVTAPGLMEGAENNG